MADGQLPDYYTLFDIDPKQSVEEIGAKLKDELRRSLSRASKAPKSEQRTEAQQRVQHANDAIDTLLDPDKRRTYDNALAMRRRDGAAGHRQPEASAPPPSTSPSPEEVRSILAQFRDHIFAGDLRRAAEVAGYLAQVSPTNADVWIALAEVHGRLGLAGDALREIQTACSLEPGNPQYRFRAGRVLLVAGDPVGAAQQFEAAARMAPDVAGYKAETGDAQLTAKNYPEAIRWFDEALVLDPANVRCRDGLAQSWLYRGYAPFSRGPQGALLLVAREAGLDAKRCAEMGLSAKSDDKQLVKELQELYSRAVAALGLVFRWPRRFRWIIRLVCAVAILASVAGQSTTAYVVGAIGLVLILGTGLRPRWWYDARELGSMQIWVTYDQRRRW